MISPRAPGPARRRPCSTCRCRKRGPSRFACSGDGQGAWLRARVRDSAGTIFPIDLANKVDWSGQWKRVTGWLPEEAVVPLTLESVYVTEFRADRRPVGSIYLDDIGASALPAVPAATTPKTQEQPR